MKMNFLFSGIFWGIILIILGITLVIKHVFNWDIPVGKIIFASILILAGISLMTGKNIFGSGKSGINVEEKDGTRTTIFSQMEYTEGGPQKEYNIIFSKGVVDLSMYKAEEFPPKMEINTIFADSAVILPKDVSIMVKGDTVFGYTSFPDGQGTPFGGMNYSTEGSSEGSKIIKVSTVFGHSEITLK